MAAIVALAAAAAHAEPELPCTLHAKTDRDVSVVGPLANQGARKHSRAVDKCVQAVAADTEGQPSGSSVATRSVGFPRHVRARGSVNTDAEIVGEGKAESDKCTARTGGRKCEDVPTDIDDASADDQTATTSATPPALEAGWRGPLRWYAMALSKWTLVL